MTTKGIIYFMCTLTKQKRRNIYKFWWWVRCAPFFLSLRQSVHCDRYRIKSGDSRSWTVESCSRKWIYTTGERNHWWFNSMHFNINEKPGHNIYRYLSSTIWMLRAFYYPKNLDVRKGSKKNIEILHSTLSIIKFMSRIT